VLAAWQVATENWDDPARHELLLGLIAQHACFTWAAARYRERDGDPIAERQLAKLRQAATVTMLATATVRKTRRGKPYQMTMALVTCLLVAAMISLAYAVVHQRAPQPSPTLAPH